MPGQPKLHAAMPSLSVEITARIKVAAHRLEQIVSAMRVHLFVGLLRSETGSSEIAVQQTRNDFVSFDCDQRGQSQIQLAAVMVGGPNYGARRHTRIEDWWHRLWMTAQVCPAPIELRSIDC